MRNGIVNVLILNLLIRLVICLDFMGVLILVVVRLLVFVVFLVVLDVGLRLNGLCGVVVFIMGIRVIVIVLDIGDVIVLIILRVV